VTPDRTHDVPEVLEVHVVPLSDEVRMVPVLPTVTNNPVVPVVVELVVLDELLDEVQDMEMKLKSRIETIMRRFFTWFPNWLVLGEPNI
jgi:hypothetical protein